VNNKKIILFTYPYEYHHYFINKDVIQFPYHLKLSLDMPLHLLVFNNAQKFNNLERFVDCVYSINRSRFKLINLIYYSKNLVSLFFRLKDIEVIILYHFSAYSLIVSFISKLFKKKVIFKMDVSLSSAITLINSRNLFYLFLNKFLMKKVDIALVETTQVITLLKDFYPINVSNKLTFFPNGLDLGTLEYLTGRVTIPMNKEDSILYVGRMDLPEKDFNFLFKILKNMNIDKLKINLVGSLNESQVKKIQTLEMELKKNGVFLQHYSSLDRVRLFELYWKSKCLVLTSYSESYGLVLNEATAFGLKILSTDVGAARDIISAYNNGYIFSNKKQFNYLLSELLAHDNDYRIRWDFISDYSYSNLIVNSNLKSFLKE